MHTKRSYYDFKKREKCLLRNDLGQKNKQMKETPLSMSLCNVLSQSVLSGAKLLKHLAYTKKLTDHLAAMATHFRGQWASPRQPITPLNPPPPYSSYVFHLPIYPSPLRHSGGQGSGHAKGSGHCPDTLIGQLIWPLLLRGQILSESWAQSEKE